MKRSPFPIVADASDMLNAYELIESLAESHQHIIPGHDPLVMNSYQPSGPKHLEIVSLTDPI
jgi:glyoxylase-like metal-dependent hydrolase (beta-lactamase superfamily II)